MDSDDIHVALEKDDDSFDHKAGDKVVVDTYDVENVGSTVPPLP